MRVAVVGAGALGTTVARDLAAAGENVALYDRDEPGAGATGRAAGLCYGAFARAVDARVGRRAMARLRETARETRFELVERPYVWLARDEAGGRAVRAGAARFRERGAAAETLDGDELGARFPALRTDDVRAATVVSDAAAAPATATYAAVTAERAAAAGADLRTGTAARVERGPAVVVDGERTAFDAVVVTAGAHTGRLLADAGVPVPVAPYRVQALVTGPTPLAADLPMGYDATTGAYWRPHRDAVLVGDGTQARRFDPEDWDPSADEAFVTDALAALSRAVAGEAPDRADHAWAGLCTATPDRDPLLGPVGGGLYVGTGLQGHGFTRAPALGEALAARVRGETGIRAFDPGRFDGDETVDVRPGMPGEGQ